MIGFSALLLIAVSAVVLSITPVMDQSRINNREVGPCRITNKQLEVVHEDSGSLSLVNTSTKVPSCTMLLMSFIVMVVQNASQIIPGRRIFFLGGVGTCIIGGGCLWLGSRKKDL